MGQRHLHHLYSGSFIINRRDQRGNQHQRRTNNRSIRDSVDSRDLRGLLGLGPLPTPKPPKQLPLLGLTPRKEIAPGLVLE